MGLVELTLKLYDLLLPKIDVDHSARTYRVVDEGVFFLNVTMAYYTIKGYEKI